MKVQYLFLTIVFLIIVLTLSGCKVCPSNCDDKNACTTDFCSAVTNNKCEHKAITPCDGNNICEIGEFGKSSDCPGCDDKNECTLDEYNYDVKECKYAPIRNCTLPKQSSEIIPPKAVSTKNSATVNTETKKYASIGEECGYVRADGTEIGATKITYYKECSSGTCQNVNCDYLYESSIRSEGSLYNCYGTCKSTSTYSSSSGKYCVYVKLTGNPPANMRAAEIQAHKDVCPSGESCVEVGDCSITLSGSDATLWDCDGRCV